MIVCIFCALRTLSLVDEKIDEYCCYPWIELSPVDNAIGFPNIYPKESDLSGG